MTHAVCISSMRRRSPALEARSSRLVACAALLWLASAGVASGQDVDLAGAIDDLSECLSSRLSQWVASVSFDNVVINAGRGVVQFGAMKIGQPNAFQNCNAGSGRNDATKKLVKAVVQGVGEKMRMWWMNYQVTLPYPATTQFAGPTMPTMPNTPVPVGSGNPKHLYLSEGFLTPWLGHLPNNAEKLAIKAAAETFNFCFDTWSSLSMIENVMGSGGRNPMFNPPHPLPGPIVDARGRGGRLSPTTVGECSKEYLRLQMRLRANLKS